MIRQLMISSYYGVDPTLDTVMGKPIRSELYHGSVDVQLALTELQAYVEENRPIDCVLVTEGRIPFWNHRNNQYQLD